MSLFTLTLIFGAVISHAAWNLVVKSAADRLGALAIVSLAIGVVGLIIVAFTPIPRDPMVWALIGLSALVHYGYHIFLLLSYRYADFSLAYPIARGSVPLLVLVLAMWTQSEVPEPLAILGICLVALCIFLLSFGTQRLAPIGFVLALVTGFWIAGYTILDGIGVRTAQPAMAYIGWLFVTHLALPIAVWGFVWRGRVPAGLTRLVPFGFLAPLAYGLVLFAKIEADLAAVSALRETSVLLAAVLGVFWLGEGRGQARVRIFAACVVMVGAALVALA